MQVLNKEFVEAFKAEAKRQETFTNSFSRQLAVILVAIILVNYFAPKILFWQTNISANWMPMQ
jgi:hypothetical protein